MNNQKKFLFLLILFVQTYSFAQKSNIQTSDPILDKSKFKVGLENCNFVWNNEYFNPIVNGYTLIGYFLRPTVGYQLSPNVIVKGGIHLLKYSGADKFSSTVPIYSVSYHLKDFTLTMGTLKGTINHRLNDVMMLSERYFTEKPENGIQAVWDSNRLFFDIWLDWRNFLFRSANDKEELTFGISSQPNWIKSNNWKISTPFSLLIEHKGGQIDASPELMKTKLNYHYGASISYYPQKNFITQINAKSEYFVFQDNSREKRSIFENGTGFLSSFSLFRNRNFVKVSYWKADKYLSSFGHPIYQCFSENGKHANERELLIAKLYLHYAVYKGIDMGLTFETFSNLQQPDFDYTTGLIFKIGL